jgi:YlmC/YmxH family sporulation protein
MDLSFCELRNKDVVNMCDGKNLGNINDIIIDSTCGRVLGIVVPSNKKVFNIFKSNNELFIPYNRICKIGKDTILVDIIMQENNCCYQTQNHCTKSNIANITNLNIKDIVDNLNNKNSR